jgi:flagellin-specific chaperone FliS
MEAVMQSAIKAYGEQRANAWTRIEMLIAIYNGAIDRIDKAQAAVESDESAVVEEHRLAAQKLVMQLISGIDLQFGNLASQMHNLCIHVATELNHATPRSLSHCGNILRKLREGFEGIREEAIVLESNGDIPGLRLSADVDIVVT